jgi:hypothetical protein
MSLEDWLKNGWLVEHKTSQAEISELLAIADRDLSDCKARGLSADWKLNIAYNSALQAATAALAAKPQPLRSQPVGIVQPGRPTTTV